MKSAFLFVLFVCASLTSGCYSFSNLGRARVLEPGQVEVWGAPEAFVVATDTGLSIRPVGELGLRVGLTPELDISGRVTTLGLSVGPRLQLLRSVSNESGFDALVAPSLSWTYPHRVAVELPLVVGLNLGDHQIVVAPRLAYQLRLDVPSYGAVSFLYGGVSVGLALRLSPQVTLMPEVSAATQLYAEPGFSSNVADGVGLQGALGILVSL